MITQTKTRQLGCALVTFGGSRELPLKALLISGPTYDESYGKICRSAL